MNLLISSLVRYAASKLTRFIIMETIKRFLKTRKGKAVVISLALGLAGITVPPEAVDAAVTFITALGW